jgi:Domain of unknown function (DUF4835)
MKNLLFRSALLSACCAFFIQTAIAQQGEILATVRINTPQLQKTDRKVFDQMEVALREWLNNTKWTNDVFSVEERIKCNFILTISAELDNNAFRGELSVQASRPVYNSVYESPLMAHLDKEVVFSYEQNQPMEFLPDVADNPNLTAMFAFYVYAILAMDYDSFSLYGGEPYLLIAQQIVVNKQNSSNPPPGWRANEGSGDKARNRHWFVENMLSPRMKPYRGAIYQYHRQGLDLFMTNMEQARTNILLALEEVDKANLAYPNAMALQMFSNAKRDELVEIWKLGTRPQKERVSQIMSKIDPSSALRYKALGI